VGLDGRSTTKFNQSGVYGTLGTAAAGNIPGSRKYAISWSDSNGNFWLFGGNGFDSAGSLGDLNDLWEFNPSTSEWTWMGGSNVAGTSGVYGVEGTPAPGTFPEPAIRPPVGPTARAISGSLVASDSTQMESPGCLMTFGSSVLPPTSGRGWVAIAPTPPPAPLLTEEWGAPGIYGTLQTPATGNFPGTRQGAVSWTDSMGNLWMFGGDGIDSAGKWGYLDDLWEFNLPSTHGRG